jgi:ABC-2 type transport system permease protein
VLEGGQEEQLDFLRSLRRSRAASFRNEIFPYFRYVFQSGFGLFISAIFFSALVWYVDFIKKVPANWPAGAVGVAVISLAALRAPLRTYLRPADPVFLLAIESRLLQVYIKPALREAIRTGVLRTVAVFLIFSPIYLRSPVTMDIANSRSIIIMAVLFAIIASFNVYGGWKERRPASRLWNRGLLVVRWIATVTSISALLLKPLIVAIPLTLLCMLVVWLMWRIPAQHALPWEKLIGEEEATRRRWMSFLGWFVDVPTETSKPARRIWIAWAGNFLLWQHRWSWHFLYAKVFLRGETFGAFSRWVALSGVVIVVSGSTLADAVIYGVSILIIGLQLSELRRVRFVETAATVPIAPEGRLVAAAAVARTAGLSAAALLGMVGGLTGAFQPDLWLLFIAAGLLWCGWWMPRKIAKFADDDDL